VRGKNRASQLLHTENAKQTGVRPNTAPDGSPDLLENVLDERDSDPVADGMLWCSAALPNGVQGHWFDAENSPSFWCSDSGCSQFGQVIHQCPVHRNVIGCESEGCGINGEKAEREN
jgi:hypothetical protein